MSNTIREYAPLKSFNDAKIMSVTATAQGKFGHGVQFTIGNNYCVLAENQVKDLIESLKKRLNCEEGYSATDMNQETLISPEVKE